MLRTSAIILLLASCAASCSAYGRERECFGELDKYEWFTVRTRDDLARLPERAVALKVELFEQDYPALYELSRVVALRAYFPDEPKLLKGVEKLKNLKVLWTSLDQDDSFFERLPSLEVVISYNTNGSDYGQVLKHIVSLPRLRVLVFGGGFAVEETHIPTAIVQELAKSRTLQKLDFTYCFFDEGTFKELANIESLEALEFYSSFGFNEEDMLALIALPKLKHLRFGLHEQTLPLARSLAKFSQLEFLSLMGGPADFRSVTINEELLTAIATLKLLRHLEITRLEVADGSVNLTCLAELLELQSLVLWCGQNDHSAEPLDLSCLTKLPKLRELDLVECWDGAALEQLAGSKQLESLRVKNCSGLGGGFAYLSECPALKRIILERTSLSDTELGLLSRVKSLEELQIVEGDFSMRGTGFARFKDHKALARVRIERTSLNENGFRALAAIPILKSLTVRGYDCKTDAALIALQAAKGLEELALSAHPDMEIISNEEEKHAPTGAGVAALAKFTKLRRLEILVGELEKEACAPLAALKDLVWMKLTFLMGSKPDLFLAKLAKLPALARVDLKFSMKDNTNAALLRNEIPSTWLEFLD